ncbi:MAG TPA: type I DNA topoisomerase, partial [Acidimicrobiales bacterium]|nr:type I DNA topoisomerase [Acidimicrobiales bacterium]
MPKPLVIVESPAKARTISGFLGDDYLVESSIGHIRDLPRNSNEIPDAYKSEQWARLGVNVDDGFKPLYVVSSEKKQQVTKLKKLLSGASEVFLATDEDREGESIAWHLMEVLNPSVPVKRMVFHEITRQAISNAVENWRDLDRRLVDAQEARRILDRLYGYEVSPVLWRKVMPKLSAGRVQSVATRMIVERERARMRHRSAAWWDVDGEFSGKSGSLSATLTLVDGKRVASGRDFGESGELDEPGSVVLLGAPEATSIAQSATGSEFEVVSVEEKPYRRSPYPPFATSTLQQEAGRKLRFSSARTMQIAQRLYENGYITYMRTDSTTLSDQAMTAARDQVKALYGEQFLHPTPRRHDKKVKNAQEAHEAIRPAGETFRTPEQLSREVSGDELKLYDLVWKRTVASQMADATGTTAQVRIEGHALCESGGPECVVTFATSGKVITFPGFLRAYVEGADDPEAELEDQEVRLPVLAVGDRLDAVALSPQEHATQPPARFTEASLVKALEELGVGRPSTYASIISTIQDRGYVRKKGSALVPTFVAFAVVSLLEQYFEDLVDYNFTASMEDDLDAIAEGREEVLPWLTRFYFGEDPHADHPGLKHEVASHLGEIDARAINSIPIGRDSEGRELVVRVGRYGPFLERGDERASLPDDICPDEVTPERAVELLEATSDERVLGIDPETEMSVLLKTGRFGPYVELTQIGDEDAELADKPKSKSKAKADQPKRASLLKSWSTSTITLEDALKVLSLPRTIGVDPADGEEIVALNGRFGPYLKKANDSRSLASEEEMFTVSLDDALAIFAQPRQRGRRSASAPLKELGPHPDNGKPIVVKDG